MAQFDDTYTSYEAVGNREDLSDIIYNIDPTETPFMMMAGRGKAKGRLHDWQVDSLAAAVDTNAQLEGDNIADGDIPAAVPTVRVSNFTQIARKLIAVSGTQEAVDKAGRKSELAYQLSKRSKELKRDMEKQLCSAKASTDGTDDTTARESAGLEAWITGDSDGRSSRASDSTGEGGWNIATKVVDAPDDGTARPFLESDLKSVIQAVWAEGGDPSVVQLGAFNKTVASGFTGNSTRMDRGEDKRVTAAVDVYVSDFGEHKFVANRFSRARSATVLTPRLWSVDYLRGFRQKPLSVTGDAEKRMLLVEYTLCSKNEKGSGIVADLTTT